VRVPRSPIGTVADENVEQRKSAVIVISTQREAIPSKTYHVESAAIPLTLLVKN
jgi:hypothetical protein